MSNLLKNHNANNSSFKFPTHSLYDKYKDDWQTIRDVIEGQTAVKAAGTRYLPRLSGQTTNGYNAFKKRAVFFGISSRLLSTNVGVIVRRSPTLEYTSDMALYFVVDRSDFLSFNEVRRELTRELTMMGRVGSLVDVKKSALGPGYDIAVPKVIPTESILNWAEDNDGNTISAVLAMTHTETDPITFQEEQSVRYYRLFLNKGVYSIEEYDEKGSSLGVTSPSLRGTTLNYIPFYPANPFGVSYEPKKSPIIDIVNINLSHYISSASLENGRHFVGLPTPYVTGATSGLELQIGAEKAWVIPSDKAKVGYLEFLGQGLQSLEKALTEKQSQMSQFSAQLMDTSTRGSEAEGTVRLRYSSDAANLTDIALSTETSLRLTYTTIAEWSKSSPPKIDLNKDFLSTKMSHNELTALTKSLVEGAITPEIFMYNLERGEMTPNKT